LTIDAAWQRVNLYPGLVMAIAGVISGVLGVYLPGSATVAEPYRDPGIGIYMVLAGIWFGIVIAFGLWRSGHRAPIGLAVALLTTWIAWEVAVNIAMLIVEGGKASSEALYYVAGALAGAAGAVLTWAGASASAPSLRRLSVATAITATGAVFGLLLPWSLSLPAVLFVPWQAAVAATFGRILDSRAIHVLAA
jgi:hypothetical protein